MTDVATARAGQPTADETGIVTKLSPRPVGETVTRLKVLIWDDAGQAKVSYYAPAALAARHHLDAGLAANLAGVDALTDAGPRR